MGILIGSDSSEVGEAAANDFMREASVVRGESPHHTNGSKATRLAHYVLCRILVDYMVHDMLVVL